MNYLHAFLSSCSVLMLVFAISRYGLTAMLPLMKSGVPLNAVQAGILSSSNFIGYLSGALLTRFINPGRNKKILYNLFLLLLVVMILLMGMTHSLRFMVFLRFTSGLISAFVFISTFAWISSVLMQNNKKELLPLLYSSVGLGIFLVSVIIGIIDDFATWEVGWISLGIFAVPFCIFSFTARPFLPSTDATDSGSKRGVYKEMPAHIKSLVIFTLIFYAAEGFSNNISATFILYNLKNLDFISDNVWKAWALVGFAGFLSPFLIRKLLKTFDFPVTLLILQTLLSLGIVMPLIENKLFIYAGSVFFGFSFLSIPPITLGFVSSLVNEGKDKIISDFTIIFSSALFISPVLGGIITDITGHYSNSVLLAFSISMVGLLSSFFINKIYRTNNFKSTARGII
ncbi:YbfB/YjiJ family MFS transporter [Flexistipes sp.]|uniref:YbfB/YjiJ family MFS transporter n=1 Tax=Flexistipes sp. TaxID=3088135 RepID=UPI002E1CD644|nr:YbfB/YjiJ family MFS transporter [Flexistipes sp.]